MREAGGEGVGGEGAARQPRPSDRALALLDPLLTGSALVVESDDILGGAAVSVSGSTPP